MSGSKAGSVEAAARAVRGWPSMVWAQVRLNHTVLVRQRGMAVSILVLPVFVAVLYAITGRGGEAIGGVPSDTYIGVGAIAMVFTTAFMSVSLAVVNRREERVYKRLRGTPLPVSAIFAGDVAHAAAVTFVQAALAAGFVLVRDAPTPGNVPLVLLAVVVGAAVFCALALGLSGLLPNTEVAQLAAIPVVLVGAVGSGVAPLTAFPGWAQRTAEVLPLTPVVRMLHTGWLGRDFSSEPVKGVAADKVGILQGFQVTAGSLGVALVWIAIGLWLTRRYFRWDPRRA
jgi:ABC-2 type transport system permease protein